MPLELRINDDDEVRLPAAVADTKLTLVQIGALVCLMAATKPGGNGKGMEERINTPEMVAAMKELKDLGVVSVSFEAGVVKVHVDLAPVWR